MVETTISRAAMLFFQLVSTRYERGSIIFASSKSFGEWGEIIGDSVTTTAILGRLMHHSHIGNTQEASYHPKEKRKAGFFTVGNQETRQS